MKHSYLSAGQKFYRMPILGYLFSTDLQGELLKIIKTSPELIKEIMSNKVLSDSNCTISKKDLDKLNSYLATLRKELSNHQTNKKIAYLLEQNKAKPTQTHRFIASCIDTLHHWFKSLKKRPSQTIMGIKMGIHYSILSSTLSFCMLLKMFGMLSTSQIVFIIAPLTLLACAIVEYFPSLTWFENHLQSTLNIGKHYQSRTAKSVEFLKKTTPLPTGPLSEYIHSFRTPRNTETQENAPKTSK